MALPNGKMLCWDMNEVDRAYLSNLCQHPGWKVVVKMMEMACENATKEVIMLDPLADGAEKKLQITQLKARVTHEFCLSFLKSVEIHVDRVHQEAKEEEEEAEMMARLAALKQELNSEA